jgi:mono/diheme cytochrome c family protein
MGAAVKALAPVLVGLAVAGCDLSMTQQPRYAPYRPAPALPGGAEAQPLPPHVVAQRDLASAQAAAEPPAIDADLLARGQERYAIFCAPCHGLAGDGDGTVVRRGFPAPPSYHIGRLRAATARHIVDVITDGYGVMYSYAARVPPRDRWAIAAYIRALQLSRSAALADVPEAREQLP